VSSLPVPDDAASSLRSGGGNATDSVSNPKSSWSAIAVAVVCVIATALLLWALPVPLGVDGEWTWSRIPFSVETAITWGAGLLAAAVYITVAWKGDEVLRRPCSPLMRGLLLAALFLTGLFLWNVIQFTMPSVHGYGRVPFVLYYPGPSGYFLQARDDAVDVKGFLHDYESLLSEGDHLHIGTHPPGLTVSIRLLLGACRNSPLLRSVLLWTEPAVVQESMQEIRLRGNLSDAEEACLWGAAGLVEVTFLLGAFCLYWLLRLDHEPHVAWRVAAIWPLIPGALVFFPKSDLLFPTLGVACAAAWFHGLRQRSVALYLLAGLLAWMGMMLSLAIAPVLLMIAVATLWTRPWSTERLSSTEANSIDESHVHLQVALRGLLTAIAWGGIGFLVPLALLWAWSGLNAFAVWSWNLHNHAQFYQHFTRTWGAWLLVNPIEFAMTLGLPITAFVIIFGVRHLSGTGRGLRSVSVSLLVAWVIVHGGLWLSGKNMGEAARLWLVFAPWPMLALAAPLSPRDAASPRIDSTRITWLSLLVSQAVCCLLTVARIDGFQFADLLRQNAP
jgi:hypothetical protein